MSDTELSSAAYRLLITDSRGNESTPSPEALKVYGLPFYAKRVAANVDHYFSKHGKLNNVTFAQILRSIETEILKKIGAPDSRKNHNRIRPTLIDMVNMELES